MKVARAAYLFAAVLVATVTLGLPGSSPAQEARGTISGTVRDATQGVVPGASVTITNVAMGTSVSVTTNESGFFEAPYLIPGTYQVSVEISGFKKYVRDGLELQVSDKLELEVPLDIGQSAETITVTAHASQLETTNASMGLVVDARRVAELPTPHGDPYALIGLSNGVSYTGSARLDRPFEPTHIVGYAMDGTRGNRSDLTIDGVPSTATANAGEVIASYVPPADTLQEFKVQTATFDASSGNTEGGVTNLSTKSGTNSLRGTVYYNKTPPKLFANDFFANANNIPLSDFTYNRYGGTAGGPVVLPGYDGRRRTFFLYGFEGIHEARPRNNGTPTVPTAKMRTGDFSELLAIGPQYQIYNPFTRRAIGGGRFQQDPFPGNIIPQELINPVARRVLEYIPMPLTAGTTSGTNNFQNPGLLEEIKYASNTIRVDHVLTNRQRLFGRVSWYDRNSNYNNYFGNLATGEWFKFISRQAAVDHVYVLNGSTVLNLRYGYNWFVRGTDSNPANRGFDLTGLGFPASYNAAIPDDIRRFPRFDITGYQGTGVNGELRPNETHSFMATLNKTSGAHSMKSGVEYRRYRETDRFFANNQTGQFIFDSTWTRGPLDNSPGAPGSLGQSFASFLLGIPSSGSVVRAASYDEKSTTWGFFVQDDWRVGSRLTVNLGLRYELEEPLTERDNRSVRGFDLNAVQPIEAAVRARYALNPTPEVPVNQFNVRGGLTFPGRDGEPRGLYETPKNNFMPRLGVAYKLNDKTALRGGYGMFYGFLGQRRGDVIQSGFSQTTSLVPSLDNGLTFIDTLSNPFQGGVQEAVGASLGAQTFVGQSITFFDPDPLSPRMQRWQVGVQRELPSGWIAEVTYVGNRGSQIQTNRNLNATPLQYLSTSPVRDQAAINYLGANVPNPFFSLLPVTAVTALRGVNITRERLLRPYPQFDAVNTTTNEGKSWYHSLQTSLQRRFSGGYTIGANYTFSRFTEQIDFLNEADPEPTKLVSSQDVPHRLTVNGILELPFGRGRRFGTAANPAVAAIIGGWQVQGIYTYQSGFPLGWGNILFTGNLDDIALPASERSVSRWFNTAAGFNTVSAQQLASNVRTFPLRLDSVRADTVNNVDLSIIKNTSLGNGRNLQFRFESLNAFNHPLFPRGNGTTTGMITSPTSSAFGSIIASTQDNYARRTQVTIKFIF
jgi:hypothetical protein